MPPDPRVHAGVMCIVRDHDNHLLMIQRKGAHGAGAWSVPGGWLEYGEDPAEAARREVLKEVGIQTSDPLPVVGRWTSDYDPTWGMHCITLWFVCFAFNVAGNDPKILEPDKIASIAWIPNEGPYPEPLFLPLVNRIKQVGRLVLP